MIEEYGVAAVQTASGTSQMVTKQLGAMPTAPEVAAQV